MKTAAKHMDLFSLKHFSHLHRLSTLGTQVRFAADHLDKPHFFYINVLSDYIKMSLFVLSQTNTSKSPGEALKLMNKA